MSDDLIELYMLLLKSCNHPHLRRDVYKTWRGMTRSSVRLRKVLSCINKATELMRKSALQCRTGKEDGHVPATIEDKEKQDLAREINQLHEKLRELLCDLDEQHVPEFTKNHGVGRLPELKAP